jgi:heat shock protein HtpX
MSSSFSRHSIGDWRETIRINQRRTAFVLLTFIFMYLSIGLLVDVFWLANQYSQASMPDILQALLSLHLMPIATLVMGALAAIGIGVTYLLHDRIVLMGTSYQAVTAGHPTASTLFHVAQEMKVAAGLSYLPKIYLIDAPYMNAFASGYSEKSAMIAVTSGLMEKLNRSELQAVVAHELSHIRHLDIKLTLTVSVLSQLMILVVDCLFWQAMFNPRRKQQGRNALFIIIIVLRYVLPLINMFLLLYLSRAREYMADAGAVELTRDNEPMAHALIKIQQDLQANKANYRTIFTRIKHESIRRPFYILDPVSAVGSMHTMSDWLSTHPAIEKRLQALGFKKNAG